jgi:hypothetical protein
VTQVPSGVDFPPVDEEEKGVDFSSVDNEEERV